jgi:outer membrane protein TolC
LGKRCAWDKATFRSWYGRRAEQQVVESRKAGAKLWLQQNPYATVMVGRRTETTSTPVAAGVQYQVHIEQALEIAGQRWTRLAVVASQTAAAKAQTALAQVESRALLWTTYMQASLADERVRVARKREEIAEQLLRSAQARMELGATGGLEVNLAQVERGRVRGERTKRRFSSPIDMRLLASCVACTGYAAASYL